jgi:hypothetical protein
VPRFLGPLPPYHHGQQQAFPQTPVSNPQAVAREGIPDRLHDCTAGQHEAGPFFSDGRQRGASFQPEVAQQFYRRVRLFAAHPAAIDLVAPVAVEFEVNPCKTGHRAGSADQMGAVLPHGPADAFGSLPGADHFAAIVEHGGKRLFFRQVSEPLVQRNHAKWQAGPVLDRSAFDQTVRAAFAGNLGVDPGQFRRTPADIDNKNRLGVFGHKVVAANRRQTRLFLCVNDLEGKAGFFVDAPDEICPIFRLPAGFGRDATHTPHAMVLQLPANCLQGVQRSLNGGIRQSAGFVQPLAQTGYLGMRIDDAEGFPHGSATSRRQLFVPRSTAA